MDQPKTSSTNRNDSASQSDDRVREISFLRKMLNRPDFASMAGLIFVLLFFSFTASGSGMFNPDGVINWMTVAAYLGIIAVGASLLMIAGEFDLSVGSMIGFSGILMTIPMVYWGWPPILCFLFSLSFCLLIGFINGFLVIKTGLPSFIVTLAFLFILRGLTLAFSINFANRTIISGVGDFIDTSVFFTFFFKGYILTGLFSTFAEWGWIETLKNGNPLIPGIPKVFVWWFSLLIIASFILARTRFGNWIFASGGDPQAAKNTGVPSDRVKITMFMFSAFCAAIYGIIQVTEIGSAAADRGLLKEFEAIIAVVIGGTLLTGGYGSVLGGAFGAIIFGMVQIGLTYTDINSDWFRVFLGLVLLIAVVFNNIIRKKITEAK